jgi:hypothetical protein
MILIVLFAMEASLAGEWSTATYLIKTQNIDGSSVIRVTVNSNAPENSGYPSIPNPASCNPAAYVDIPLNSTADARKEKLVNLVNLALLNQHHVVLEIDETSCSSDNIRILEGIRIEKSHHHPGWPVGDWDQVIPAYNNGVL